MRNTLHLEQNDSLQIKIQKRNRKRKQIYKCKKYSYFFKLAPICSIIICAFLSTHILYISSNCKDLYYATEYYFTHGFSSENKLLRVKNITLISCNENTAVIEVYGLSKNKPHKSISIRGNFKKDTTSSWYLDSIS